MEKKEIVSIFFLVVLYGGVICEERLSGDVSLLKDTGGKPRTVDTPNEHKRSTEQDIGYSNKLALMH